MAEIQKSRWRQEFDALPPWAQKLVTALQGLACTSHGAKIDLPFLDEEKHKSVTLTLKKEGHGDFAGGLDGACELARALTCHRNRDDFRHEDCPGFVANKIR